MSANVIAVLATSYAFVGYGWARAVVRGARPADRAARVVAWVFALASGLVWPLSWAYALTFLRGRHRR